MYKNTANTYISSEFFIAAQNSKQVGVAIRFVARFGRSKVRALGLVSSGVKEREANRSDVEKNGLIRDGTALERSEAVKERSHYYQHHWQLITQYAGHGPFL